jgi:hypothetical protein
MSIWNHYFVTEQKPVRLEHAERALQAASPDFYIDGDTVVLRDGYEGSHGKEELECGQITIESIADPALLPSREFFEVFVAGKQSRDRLLAVLWTASKVSSPFNCSTRGSGGITSRNGP